jgi:hypothetical protein
MNPMGINAVLISRSGSVWRTCISNKLSGDAGERCSGTTTGVAKCNCEWRRQNSNGNLIPRYYLKGIYYI